MPTALILLVSLSVVAAVPFDTSAHFPYGPFGTLKNVEHHFLNPTKALTASKGVKMASKRQDDTAESSSMSDEHFPYQPFGARPFEHHFVSLGRGNNNGVMKKTRVASNKQVDTTESSSSTKPKAKKDVKMVSTNSITDLPNPDDFQEAQEAVFHAVEKVERSLFRFAKRCEQAVEHAIEEEVDVLFCNGKKET
jgi:hypothetical protein